MLLWGVIEHSTQQPSVEQQSEPVTVAPVHSTIQVVETCASFITIAGVWIFLMFIFPKIHLHRLYRKDPLMQGQFTVNITPESFSTQNTVGSSTKSGWNIYDYWREGKDIILLVLHSGAYFLLSLANLSDAQRSELRGILTSTLPKK
jgi:hypothetical protein